ncbi:MAG TPA: HEPN domain-containing protein [Draconibacterium sp.]|nr:HEPN domain-containing protein [Draconibacterium sp.]
MNLEELIKYRRERAKETLEEAKILAEANHWNAVANRLYYSCFYMVNAMLLKNELSFNSHNGVKTAFHQQFIKTNIISRQSGRLYNRLFNLRQEGDYLDFKRLDKDTVFPFIEDVNLFITELDKLFVN